ITVQDTIAQRIADGLRIELSPEEQAGFEQRATYNAEAYEEYLKGRDSLGRFIFKTVDREDIDQAISHFQLSAELDPQFALAHSGIGSAYINRTRLNVGEADDHETARASFERALALDPN